MPKNQRRPPPLTPRRRLAPAAEEEGKQRFAGGGRSWSRAGSGVNSSTGCHRGRIRFGQQGPRGFGRQLRRLKRGGKAPRQTARSVAAPAEYRPRQ